MSSVFRSKPAFAALAVTALPLPMHLVHQPHAGKTRHTAAPAATQPARPKPEPPAPARPKLLERTTHPRVLRLAIPAGSRPHPAGDPSDTIADFKFSPATLTIHVGDTVTWTNDGQQPHTATANDHSFDTGVLNKGASASHTFTQAGSFAYICTIHPFMHGTIVVEGSSSSTTGSASSGSTGGGGSSSNSASNAGTTNNTASSTAATPSARNTLPNTGIDITLSVLCGAALIGAGTVLLRGSRTHREW
jgi:hypothetical protein